MKDAAAVLRLPIIIANVDKLSRVFFITFNQDWNPRAGMILDKPLFFMLLIIRNCFAFLLIQSYFSILKVCDIPLCQNTYL